MLPNETVSSSHNMSSTTAVGITIGQIARALRCHERSARLYLKEVNDNIDCYAQNLAEIVDRKTIIALQQRYANNVLARRLKSLM